MELLMATEIISDKIISDIDRIEIEFTIYELRCLLNILVRELYDILETTSLPARCRIEELTALAEQIKTRAKR